MTMTTKIWFLLLDNEKKLLGTCFSAKAPHIYGLKRAIEKQYSQLHVKTHHLVVWRCKKPLLSTQNRKELREHLSEIDLGNREQVFRLTNGAKTADLELGEDEVLLVQVLGAISKFIFLLLFSSVSSRPVL